MHARMHGLVCADGASWVSQDDNSEEILVQKALDYITKAIYPPGASKNDKRVIRKKAAKFSVQDGQIFYAKKGAKKV